MKILMSAFSCGPGQGSDPGIGWNMALETARLGHEVVVLTQSEFRTDIEREIATGRLPANLRFDVFMPSWLEWLRDAGLKRGVVSLTWHVVSVLWQFCALYHVRRHYQHAGFDLIHHVSLSGIRHPTLLTRTGVPTVIGPLGGGETAPMALRKTYPWKDWWTELFRDVHTRALRADPMTRLAFRDAKLIVLRTNESLVAVPPRFRHKVYINIGLGIAESGNTKVVPRKPGETFRIIYAGRLLCWKGVHLALRAVAGVRARGMDVTLTIVGDGPFRRRLEALAGELGIAERVTWFGEITRQQLLEMYGGHHAFLFPSLHDAGGTVILEAWRYGLPVVCLALGGPGHMVDETCGRVVAVTNRSENECVALLAAEIIQLAANEQLRLALSRGAIQRCRQFWWSQIVGGLYAEIEKRLQYCTAGDARLDPGGVPAGRSRCPGYGIRRDILRSVAVAALMTGSVAVNPARGVAGPVDSLCPPGSITIEVGASIQAAVDRAGAGAAFCLNNGIHRMQVVRPKPGQSFYGRGHTVLNGSRLLTMFSREGRYWIASGQEQRGRNLGRCAKEGPGCNVPVGLFIDDQALTPVLSKDQLETGHFYFDQAGHRIYFADDPTGRKVEATAAVSAFQSLASGILIRNLTVEKYASAPQKGAIQAEGTEGWVVDQCEIRLNNGAGVAAGTGGVIRDCDIHNNGQLGIGGAGRDILIENNRVWKNNFRRFSSGWEAGGVKLALGDGVVFRGNHVFDNIGPGLWCDINCRNVLYENNIVERNYGAGIFHEISYAAVVRGNTLRHNGSPAADWFWGDDILIAASQDTEVYGNTLTVGPGKCGIMLIDQSRTMKGGSKYKTRNNRIYDNQLTFEGAACAGGASDTQPGDENFSIITDGGNLFDGNVYRVPRASGFTRFVWGHEVLDWDALRAKGVESNGRLILY